MNLFFDTPALVKYYVEEQGSSHVEALIENTENVIWISELAKIEFVCALFRRLRSKELNKEELEVVVAAFETSIQQFHVQPLNSLVSKKAEEIIMMNGTSLPIRTLDALHLSTFHLLKDENEWSFVTADKAFSRFAEESGARVICSFIEG